MRSITELLPCITCCLALEELVQENESNCGLFFKGKYFEWKA